MRCYSCCGTMEWRGKSRELLNETGRLSVLWSWGQAHGSSRCSWRNMFGTIRAITNLQTTEKSPIMSERVTRIVVSNFWQKNLIYLAWMLPGCHTCWSLCLTGEISALSTHSTGCMFPQSSSITQPAPGHRLPKKLSVFCVFILSRSYFLAVSFCEGFTIRISHRQHPCCCCWEREDRVREHTQQLINANINKISVFKHTFNAV